MVKNCTIWNDNYSTDNYRLGFEFEDDNKPNEIILSNRDDDKNLDSLRWEFKIVDKEYIDRSDTNLQNQIDTNRQNIQNNRNLINTNIQNIQNHENRITNLEINTFLHTYLKTKIVENMGSLYRYLAYIERIKNNEVLVNIDIDLWCSPTNFVDRILLSDILPWINDGNNENLFGINIYDMQTPTILTKTSILTTNEYGSSQVLSDNELCILNTNGQNDYKNMELEINFRGKAHGRIFLQMKFTY